MRAVFISLSFVVGFSDDFCFVLYYDHTGLQPSALPCQKLSICCRVAVIISLAFVVRRAQQMLHGGGTRTLLWLKT
jgi:hypothetical protein